MRHKPHIGQNVFCWRAGNHLAIIALIVGLITGCQAADRQTPHATPSEKQPGLATATRNTPANTPRRVSPTATPTSLPVTEPRPTTPAPSLMDWLAFVAVKDFQFGRQNTVGIYVVRADGEDMRTVIETNRGHILALSWTPDGSRIAFSGDPDDPVGSDIYAIDVDSSNLQRLTEFAGVDKDPAWSPDGKHIAYSREQGPFQVFIMDKDGGNSRHLTEGREPAWSPDGEWIAFVRNRPNEQFNTDLFIIRADGSELRQLTDDPVPDRGPVWSPDGKRIAFWKQKSLNPVFVFDLENNVVSQLASSRSYAEQPTWSSDGTQIAFIDAHTDRLYLGSILPDSGVRPLLENLGNFVFIDIAFRPANP